MRQRQIHLDFHTSPYIPEVASEFDASEFARTMSDSHVNSVTVFSKCHHGMAYFPSEIVPLHPHIPEGLDLMGSMIESLHSKQIKAPIYTTVGWEEYLAHEYPEWRQMKKDGSFALMDPSPDGVTVQPGMWKFLDFSHPHYQEYFESHLEELLKKYPCDGFFIDILFFHPDGTWSESCQQIREKLRLKENNQQNMYKVEHFAQSQFAQRMTRLIHSYQPNATVFYNTPNNRFVDAQTGIMGKTRHQTHIEIESLPTGFWGYYHFPRVARHLSHKGKKWLSMTGKFQKMWGDFGGIKPQAALEYETFRAQALGGAISIGDQLHPNGILDKATYTLIEKVYRQIKDAEPFYENAKPIKEIGVVTPNHTSKDEKETGKSEEGAVMLLESFHYQVDVLDDESDFDGYKLIILPDDVVITEALGTKLEAYVENEGKLLVSFKSFLDEDQNYTLKKLPISYEGPSEMRPTYWSVDEQIFSKELQGERVIYHEGLNVSSNELDVWVSRILPYFKRSELKFCSHFQAPPDRPSSFPAVLGNDKVVYFADPIFREYRQTGNYFVKCCLKEVLEKLIGPPAFGKDLSPEILSVALRKENDLLITLIYYSAARKAIEVDVVEQPHNFYGEELTLQDYSGELIDVLGKRSLSAESGSFKLPDTHGRLLLLAKNYFTNKFS